MILDLRSIIDNPGSSIAFEYEPDVSDISIPSIVRFIEPPTAIGDVTNRAGVLCLVANLTTVCECTCAACINEFEFPIDLQISTCIVEDNEENRETDNYYYYDDKIELDDIIITELLLNIDDRILCREDCAGLCQMCGHDLNTGLCDCKKEVDPRLAKLAELLDT
jgi:uncharacterized protein